MKKVIYLLFISLIFIPVLVCASTFNNAEKLTKKYIKNFLCPERYVKVDSGDFISREEVEQTMVRKDSDNRLLTVSSYMFEGTRFWAKDRYVIAEKIEQKPQNENYKTKVTQIVKHDAKVKGTGKKTDPWIFVDSFKVTVSTIANGTIDGQQSVTKSVDSNGNVSFTIVPESGYKYLNNDCGGNSEVAGNILTIRNVEKDISCSVSFETSKYSNTLPVPYKDVFIKLTNSTVRYRFNNPGPVPNSFSSRYLNGYYTDDTLKTRIGKLTSVPTRAGWTFKGYYVGTNQTQSTMLVSDKGFFETSYSLLKDNVNKEEITFQVEENKYNITFLPEGGVGGTPEVKNWLYEHDMPEITIPGRKGYTFEGYYTEANGRGTKYYNASGREVKIFEMSTPGNLTLHANWTICPVGSYCPGDNVAYPCPRGYSTASTGSEKCTQCRYWDPCFSSHQECRYGCDTCTCEGSSTCCCQDVNGDAVIDSWECLKSSYSYSCPCGCSGCHHTETVCDGAWVYLPNENTCVMSRTDYNVTLDKKGGTGGIDSYALVYFGTKPVSIINGDESIKSFDIPTKAGYVFDGYYTRENGGGVKIINKEIKYKSSFDENAEYTENELNTHIESIKGTVIESDLAGKNANKSGSTFTLYANWIPCPKGYRCPGDNKKYACLSGQYQDGEAKASCISCVNGSYSTSEGAYECFPCGNGVTNSETGNIACNKDCSNIANTLQWETATWNTNNTVTNNCKIKTCEAGYYLNSNACTVCPKGNRCPGDNKKYACTAGTYQNETGKTSCKDCVAGSYSTAGLDKCIACTNGKTSNAKSGSCSKNCSNNANVKTWETASWNTNNTVTNNCKIKSCNSGYKVSSNKCVKNTCSNWGSDIWITGPSERSCNSAVVDWINDNYPHGTEGVNYNCGMSQANQYCTYNRGGGYWNAACKRCND